MLSTGELAPGTRLVNRTLAKELGVSFAPLREAINRLASEGLIQQVPGSGAFVREPSRDDLEDLYVLREANEACAARLAAKNISEDELSKMFELCDRWAGIADELRALPDQRATPELFDRWLHFDETFHELLVEASRNKLLAKVVREHRILNELFGAHRNNPEILTLEVAERTPPEHRELAEALRDRDGERAARLSTEQIEVGRKNVLAHFDRALAASNAV